ncbi:hypothetical protein D3C80_1479290 [compost metagenome]
MQRGTDDLFQRLPLFTQVKTTGLNARHIQQIVYQAGGTEHLLADLAGLWGVAGAFGGQIQRQDLCLTKQHGKWSTQIVGEGGQQRVT